MFINKFCRNEMVLLSEEEVYEILNSKMQSFKKGSVTL